MLLVYVEAPFGTFRTFTAGWFRPTATFLTPSAAYGLLLNVAGIESRLREGQVGHDEKTPGSLIRADLPAATIAVGAAAFRMRGKALQKLGSDDDVFPRVQSAFQQLHNYPVGKGNKVDDPDDPGEKVYQGDLAARRSGGNKYNITPVRREFLSQIRAVIAAKLDPSTEKLVQQGLAGELKSPRYGIPFLGDNSFLIDRLEAMTEPGPVHWYERINGASDSGRRDRTTRLTIAIDRADLSRTTSSLFAPGGASTDVPDAAWVQIG